MQNLVNTQNTISSLEVAEMTGKSHSHLCRDIENYIADINAIKNEEGQNPNLVSDNFFIESSYVAGTGKNYKCYECTKQGCEFIANKMTGTKGNQFTAVYVSRFNAMEQQSFIPASNHTLINTATAEMVEVKKNLLALFDGLQSDNATVSAIGLVANETGINPQPLLSLAPPVKREVGYMTATDIGRRFNPIIKPADVNNKLEKLGFQTFTREGKNNRKVWHLTDEGKQYGEVFLESKKSGHGTVPIIKWNDKVIGMIA